MRINKKRIASYLVILVACWFVFLCLLNYFAQKEGMDERPIIKNMQELSVPQLFGPLKYDQVFPRAYLALISAFSGQFAYSWFALRFFPLLFMFAGFGVWLYLYKQESSPGLQYFLMVFSFAASVFTTYYAALLKQYSCDLFAIAVFTLFVYFQQRYFNKPYSLKTIWIFSLLSPLLLFFSQMSFLVMGIVFYNFFFLIKRDRKAVYPFLGYCVVAVAACALVYWFDIRYSMQVKFMQEYWKDCFVDTGSFYGFIKTFTNGLRYLIVRWTVENSLARSIGTVFLPFALAAIFIGFKASFKKFKGAILDLNTVCGILLAELFVLGALKIYPFTGARITMFIAPFIFYMIVKGIYLTKRAKFVFYPLLAVYIVFLSGVSGHLLLNYLSFYAK